MRTTIMSLIVALATATQFVYLSAQTSQTDVETKPRVYRYDEVEETEKDSSVL